MAKTPAPLNRDLSWLAFNDRVLYQAEDERLPLLERVKFCAIYANNLDEFFMKRVGLAKRRIVRARAKGHHATTTRDGMPVTELLREIRTTVVDQQSRLHKAWNTGIRPGLSREGIHILCHADLDAGQRQRLDDWFDANVFPVLTPLSVDPSHPFPFISNLSENLGVIVRQPSDPDAARVFARVKIPTVVPRFVPVPAGEGDEHRDRKVHELIPLDELLAVELDRLFPGMETDATAPFRVTRSAAVEEEDDDPQQDVLEDVEDELRKRRFAEAVRIELPEDASQAVLNVVVGHLRLGEDDIYRRRGPLEYADLFEIASLPRPDLKIRPWTPAVHPALRGLAELPANGRPSAAIHTDARHQDDETIFDRIRRGDILVHHPYDSFRHSVERFVEEASIDPDVVAIKQTIYRTSPDSPFVRSLVRAAEAGKNVACLVELRARFDEERNVTFARQLEYAGVHVAYGVMGLKTHCKLSMVVRREHGSMRTYAHVGTGNYHPRTAQLYTDLGLLTADPSLTADAVQIFNTLTGHAARHEYARFLVAPKQMRDRFVAMIDAEAEAARAGEPARIACKMNQLEDPEIIDALYRASAAGVPTTLFVRGFSTIRPGVAGVSDNIRVVSVVGRLLEHARIFHFAQRSAEPTDGAFYIGSADWMSRNLSGRVEVCAPVDDRLARARLWRILDVMNRDRRNAWIEHDDGRYTRLEPDAGGSEGGSADDAALRGTFSTLMNDADPSWTD